MGPQLSSLHWAHLSVSFQRLGLSVPHLLENGRMWYEIALCGVGVEWSRLRWGPSYPACIGPIFPSPSSDLGSPYHICSKTDECGMEGPPLPLLSCSLAMLFLAISMPKPFREPLGRQKAFSICVLVVSVLCTALPGHMRVPHTNQAPLAHKSVMPF